MTEHFGAIKSVKRGRNLNFTDKIVTEYVLHGLKGEGNELHKKAIMTEMIL